MHRTMKVLKKIEVYPGDKVTYTYNSDSFGLLVVSFEEIEDSVKGRRLTNEC